MFPNGQEINSNLFLNFEDVLLMVEILHQVWYHIHPIMYRVLYIPGGFLAGFLPSIVAVVCFPKDGDRHSRSGRSFWSGISDLPPDALEYQNTEIFVGKSTAGTQKWRFRRCFIGWFLGSMSIFQGACNSPQFLMIFKFPISKTKSLVKTYVLTGFGLLGCTY